MPRIAAPAALLSLALILPPALLGASPTPRPDLRPDPRPELERRIPELLRDGDVPGLSIAVIRDGEIYWSGAFGIADRATGAAVKPETIFQAASLSKPVFAYLVLQLADRGVLALDTPLATYLPYERLAGDERAQKITARMVLSHTTGLPNWGGDTLHTRFPPGERWSYSGEGFFYLQKVVEKLTATPLAELARREVFAPLGMRHSSYVWQDGFAGATGVDEAETVEPTDPRQRANAAASLLTTAGDYARFLVAVLHPESAGGLKAATAAAMLTPQVHVPTRSNDPFSPPREDIAWGLGWGLVTSGESEVFWHWGHQDAWRAFTATRRDGKAGLVFFANSHNGLAIARALAALAGVGGLPILDWQQYESCDDPRWIARRELLAVFSQEGAAAGLRRFAALRSGPAGTPGVADAKMADELADLLIARGKGAEAAALLQQNAAAADARVGEAWLAAGEVERALASYETAAQLDPATPRDPMLRWLREALEVKKNPVSIPEETLRRFAGDYGPRHLQLEDGHLVYHRDGRPTSPRLVPAGADIFLVEGNAGVRFRVVADAGGRVTKLVLLGPDGPQDESPRDP